MRHTLLLNWFFSRKPARLETIINVSVSLQDGVTGEVHPAVLDGVITECSERSARLQLPKLMVEGKHVFFSTLQNERYHLLLDFEPLAENDQPTEIAARSVWMDTDPQNNRTVFYMGIRFLERQRELIEMLRSYEQAAFNGQRSDNNLSH
jgi:hypothetical protein